MQIHPVANIFPAMSAAEFEALKADIAQHGQRERVWTYQGQIIDGRHRARACEELGLPVATQIYEGDESNLVAFVVSLNLHRRHLDESQRAMVASRLATLPRGANQHAQICAPSQDEAAELLNVSRRSVQQAKKVSDDGAPELVEAVEQGRVSVNAAATIAEAPKDQQREIVARGEKEILEAAKQIRAEKAVARREERLEKLRSIAEPTPELKSDRRYPVIYADPPWRYEHAESMSREIENHYPTMTLEDICALPVASIATEDAILFMWATSPKLREAMDVLEAWGFTYRTCAIWAKPQIGMGYYFRQQHELLLVATRGEMPTPLPADRPGSVITLDREEHSAKPDAFYEIIEGMYDLPRIELFARKSREGWAAWGNQAAA